MLKSKFKIAIDARLITTNPVGISRYAFSLIEEISRNNIATLYCLVNNDYCEKKLFRNDRLVNVHFIKARSKPLSFFEHFEIPFFCLTNKIDLFHATSYMTPIWVPCKFVYSILDTFHLIFPEGFSKIALWYFRIIVRSAARNAQCILTISESSKNDIKKFITSTRPIVVTYLGYSNIEKNEKSFERTAAKYGIQKPGYFLFLGNHRFHKNSAGAIAGYSLAANENKHLPDLILNTKKLEENITVGLHTSEKHNIRHIGFIDEEDLYTIYKNAICLVMPSLYEGFGLNILEAMDIGIPVISSNTSSIPEVAGDAVLYVDPYDTKQISEAIQKIFQDPILRNDLVKKGKERIQRFSWHQCAEETYSVYKNILVNKHYPIINQ